uniref:Uncharacterized protein n=1 Tax=Meloidogyne enterolobii TaxID=390850 RepID=A0A6V7XMS0_MELEN|nr:unnamed protein product [Meloidogyne enterolobii]
MPFFNILERKKERGTKLNFTRFCTIFTWVVHNQSSPLLLIH